MGNQQLGPADLKRLIRIMEDHGLAEIDVEEQGVRVALRLAPQQESPGPPAPQPEAAEAGTVVPHLAPPAPSVPQEGPPPPEEDPRYARILSPMTGCFYRASSPGDPPLVELGDQIEEQQPIGLIEAMKVFSEILSEVAGRVVALPVENGEMVSQGQVLAVVDPSGGSA